MVDNIFADLKLDEEDFVTKFKENLRRFEYLFSCTKTGICDYGTYEVEVEDYVWIFNNTLYNNKDINDDIFLRDVIVLDLEVYSLDKMLQLLERLKVDQDVIDRCKEKAFKYRDSYEIHFSCESLTLECIMDIYGLVTLVDFDRDSFNDLIVELGYES